MNLKRSNTLIHREPIISDLTNPWPKIWEHPFHEYLESVREWELHRDRPRTVLVFSREIKEDAEEDAKELAKKKRKEDRKRKRERENRWLTFWK